MGSLSLRVSRAKYICMMNIAVLVSGGVDSSVALALLKEQGHAVTAYYLKIWLEDEMSYLGNCPWEEDLSYAQAVCDQLDVELRVVPLQKEYHARVVSYTIDAVQKGLTPNPDVHCNAQVKFGAFLEKYGDAYDRVATGHYAQVLLAEDGDVRLFQAPDAVKDQTYFLAMMDRVQLAKALFPIGHLEKKDVRVLAEKFSLPTAGRKDSQGICFLGKISFRDFIRHHLGTLGGRFVEKESGNDLGAHDGHYFYTIGQRRGIDVHNGPWYVCGKNVRENIVYLTHGFSGDDYSRDGFSIRQCNWLVSPRVHDVTKVKLRHGPAFQKVVSLTGRGDVFDVRMACGDRSVTPGQYAVFYTEDGLCVGAGSILDS